MKMLVKMPGLLGLCASFVVLLFFLLQPIKAVSCEGMSTLSQSSAVCAALSTKLQGKLLFFSSIHESVMQELLSQQLVDSVSLGKVSRGMGGNLRLHFKSVDVVAVLIDAEKISGITADGTVINFAAQVEDASEAATTSLLKATVEQTWKTNTHAEAFLSDLVRFVSVFSRETKAQELHGITLYAIHPTWIEVSTTEQLVFLLDLSVDPSQAAKRLGLIVREIAEFQQFGDSVQPPVADQASPSAKKQVRRVDWATVREVDLRFRLPVVRTQRSHFGDNVLAAPTEMPEEMSANDESATAPARSSKRDTPIDSPE